MLHLVASNSYEDYLELGQIVEDDEEKRTPTLSVIYKKPEWLIVVEFPPEQRGDKYLYPKVYTFRRKGVEENGEESEKIVVAKLYPHPDHVHRGKLLQKKCEIISPRGLVAKAGNIRFPCEWYKEFSKSVDKSFGEGCKWDSDNYKSINWEGGENLPEIEIKSSSSNADGAGGRDIFSYFTSTFCLSRTPEDNVTDDKKRAALFYLNARPLKRIGSLTGNNQCNYHWAIEVIFPNTDGYGLIFDASIVKNNIQQCCWRSHQEENGKMFLCTAFISPQKLCEIAKANRLNDQPYDPVYSNCQTWCKQFINDVELYCKERKRLAAVYDVLQELRADVTARQLWDTLLQVTGIDESVIADFEDVELEQNMYPYVSKLTHLLVDGLRDRNDERGQFDEMCERWQEILQGITEPMDSHLQFLERLNQLRASLPAGCHMVINFLNEFIAETEEMRKGRFFFSFLSLDRVPDASEDFSPAKVFLVKSLYNLYKKYARTS